jgi:uroporphyrinogen-III decarboxylase
MSYAPDVSVRHGLDRLLKRYFALYESEENQRRLRHRGVPYAVLPEFPLLAAVTDARLKDTYLDPEAFVCFTLAHRIYRFERWRDCTPLARDIAYWPGVILETSIFGMEPVYLEREDPWIAHRPIASSLEDIDRLRAPFTPGSGVVRLMLEMTEYCRDRLPGFTVHVQAWDRAAVGTAMDLMGTEDFLMNAMADPELVHALMRKVTDARYAWSEARNACLTERGLPVASSISPGTGSGSNMVATDANIIADEVNKPVLPLSMYDEFVHPYDREVVEHYGALNYYHSCGCLTPFLPAIASLRPATQHVSYWTDLDTAVRIYEGTPTLLQKTLHPLRDVLDRDADGMAEVLRGIRKLADGRVKYCVIANGIDNPTGNMALTLSKCDQWVGVAAGVFGG